MKLAILFHRLGPYHKVRLEAAGQCGEIWCVEGGGRDTTYAWDAVPSGSQFHRLTLFPDKDIGQMSSGRIRRLVFESLDRIDPAVVLIPGWENGLSLAALEWAVTMHKPVVVMSDSNYFDGRRNRLKESIKSRLVSLCTAGLVAGTMAAKYLAELGMHYDQIFFGYDVVDNDYFAAASADARTKSIEMMRKYGLPERYFLASARFIEKKNLSYLLHSFAAYRWMMSASERWELVLLGDGPLREEVESQSVKLGIADCIHLPGFKQYGELPIYYALASCFVHASIVEQWGLVVNEAMASGLPVLVSDRCGCAPDLVQDGNNGFVFDPVNAEELAGLMVRMSHLEPEVRDAMGARSREIICGWSPQLFGKNVWSAASAACARSRPKASVVDRALLWSLRHFRCSNRKDTMN